MGRTCYAGEQVLASGGCAPGLFAVSISGRGALVCAHRPRGRASRHGPHGPEVRDLGVDAFALMLVPGL